MVKISPLDTVHVEPDQAQKGGEEQPEEGLVQLERELLTELPQLQKDLDAFINGYISLQEMLNLCKIIENTLEEGIEDRGAMSYRVFWTNVRDRLDEAYNIYLKLNPLIDTEIKERYEQNHQKLIHEFSLHSRNPRGVDVENIASTGLTIIREMKTDVQSIIVTIKESVNHKLDEIRMAINLIERRIKRPGKQIVGGAKEQKTELSFTEGKVDRKEGSHVPTVHTAAQEARASRVGRGG